MQTQTEQTTPPSREVVFDENGNTVEEIVAAPEARSAEGQIATEETAVPPTPPPKYRIGDKTFATQEEALSFAQSHVTTLETETQVANAYRQGIRDGMQPTAPTTPNVTPPEPTLNTEELYTNPQEFLKKYGQQITEKTLATVQQQLTVKQQSDQIWGEFCNRHPEMADFRAEVEGFVDRNVNDVRAVIATKGRDASYDWITTKLKAQFERYTGAVKPGRPLPNTRQGASPNSRAGGQTVTPPEQQKKPSTFAEQLRSMRRKSPKL
jgi:hypothetical protein